MKTKLVLALLLATACSSPEVDPPEDCGANGCPTGFTCVPRTGRCELIVVVSPDATAAEDAPPAPDASPAADGPPDALLSPDATPPPDAQAPPDALLPDALPPDAALAPDAGAPADASAPDAPAPPDAKLPPDAKVPPDAAPPDAPPEPPVILTATIRDYGSSHQVRQGAVVFVDLAGTGLDTLTAATIGDLDVSFDSPTATAVTLTVFVPHGASLGKRDLVISSAGGSDGVADFIEVTNIIVSMSGDDTTGTGTPERPFRTVTTGSGWGGNGDKVIIGPGVYDEGEMNTAFVQSGALVTGAGPAQTIISSSTDACDIGRRLAFSVKKGGTLEKVRIQGFCTAISTASGAGAAATIRDVDIADSSLGIVVDFANNVVLERVNIQTASVSLSMGNSITKPVVTLSADELTTTATIRTNDGVTLSLNHTTVSSAAGPGLTLYGGTVTLRNSHIGCTAGNPFPVPAAAIDLDGNYDLGTPGTNVFTVGRSDAPTVLDSRPARPAPDGPIVRLVGATLNGMSFAPAIVTGPASFMKYWGINQANNRMQF